MQINKAAVEADINVFKCKIALHQAVIDAHVQKSAKERKLILAFLKLQPGLDSYMINQWETAYMAHSNATQAVLEFDVIQMKQQIAIREAMIADGERNVVVPGGYKA